MAASKFRPIDEILHIKDWRHSYDFGGGVRNQVEQPWYPAWHEWRYGVDRNNINTIVGGIRGKSLLDLACNDGYYGLQYACSGATRVVGIDGRLEHIRRGELLKAHFELTNIELRVGDIEEMSADDFGSTYDVVLMYGLLYHLCNPIGTLRTLGKVTGRMIAIQTFMGDSAESALLLHDDDVELPGSGLSSLVCRPTQSAIVRMLQHAGFPTVMRVCPYPYFAHPMVQFSRKRHLGFFYGIKGTDDELASIRTRLGVTDAYQPQLERTQIVRLDATMAPLTPPGLK